MQGVKYLFELLIHVKIYRSLIIYLSNKSFMLWIILLWAKDKRYIRMLKWGMGKNGWSTRPVGIDLWEFDQISLRRFKKIKKYWIVVFYELKVHMVLFHWRGYKVQSRRKPGQISWNKAKCSAVTRNENQHGSFCWPPN